MSWREWHAFAELFRPERYALLAGVAVAALQSVMLLPIAWLVQHAFDREIPGGHVARLAWIAAAILALQVASVGLTLWSRHIQLAASKRGVARLRAALLAKLQELPRSFYDRAEKTRLHDQIVHDSDRLDVVANSLLGQLLPSTIVVLVLCGVLLRLEWRLFLLLVLVMPLLAVVSRRVSDRMRRLVFSFRGAFGDFSRDVLFTLRHVDLIRLQTAEQLELERQQRTLEHLRSTSGRLAWAQTAYSKLQHTIVACAGVLILIAGGAAVAAGDMSLGELAAFYAVVGLLGGYARDITGSASLVVTGRQSLAELLALRSLVTAEPYTGRASLRFTGHVRLEGVSFRYADRAVLDQVDLELAPGRLVAIRGPNGAGKSTLAHLVLAFYRPQRGRLLADGRPYDELDVSALRRQIGVVPQDPVLVEGSVLHNIRYGCPEASEAAVLRAARLATAHEFVSALPEGYATGVGDAGVLLSGGQRQRIAIARALLREPKLLVLDEPTLHLDAAAVAELVANLRALTPECGILLISHDAALVASADEIHQLEDGRLSREARLPRDERGTRASGAAQPGRVGLAG